jgi:CubicO group peptidase (beta-lactamase class C family)
MLFATLLVGKPYLCLKMKTLTTKSLFQPLLFAVGLMVLLDACNATKEPELVKPTLGALVAEKLEDTLKSRGIGYAFVVYEKDQLVAKGAGGLRSNAADNEGEKPFTEDTKMHIASMTKTLSAMAFLKAASQKNIRLSDSIGTYLPPGWPKGSGIQSITFERLLTHRSGIVGLGANCQNGAFSENIYSGLRQLVAKGVRTPGTYCYQNANFGLLRVLIPSIMGYKFTGNDATDDAQTQQLYLAFLQKEIFDKVGINNVATGSIATNMTYTYNVPIAKTQRGWNPGQFSATTGGYGIYLTATEAAKIYAIALNSNLETILTKEQTNALITQNLGVYKSSSTAGAFAYHDGLWQSGLFANGQGLRTIWMTFPNDLTCVLFVNALKWRNNSLNFPFNNGLIVGFIYNAYAQAIQKKNMRVSAIPPLHIEHPEPH